MDEAECGPVQRIQRFPDQGALNISVEERRLEHLEDFVAVECIGRRGEAAAGDRRNDIDLVQQTPGPAFGFVRGIAQRLQQTIGKRCRARSPAGERHQENDLIGIVFPLVIPRR